ncbi:MAG: DUF6596 domain-containing protein [Pseudomonadota bacterium]
MSEAKRAAEIAARDSYGRLLAFLSTRTKDIALAEDVLADAFMKALDTWPETGVPDNPDAWLLTTARNRLTDHQRRDTRTSVQSEFPEIPMIENKNALEDRRLELLMVCAHPSIAADLHTPLMLQTVLGIKAETIAQLFLISPPALAKRLVRAKAKIRDAGIPFEVPDKENLQERSGAIFEAVYALHAHDWLDPADGLGEEALYLANLLCKFLPDNAEALGLAALISLSHARRDARVVDGVLVPIEEQDTQAWDAELVSYGNNMLARAHQLSSIGRFQIEAAIESVHVARKKTGVTDWAALQQLFYALVKLSPTAGAMVSQAVVTANNHGIKAGLTMLDEIEKQIGARFQPLWAARAELLSRSGKIQEALRSYDKAISLTTDIPVLRFLRVKRSKLDQ